MAAVAPGGVRKSGVILCIGDSLTAGTKGTKDSYPGRLEGLLQQNGYAGFYLKNAGVWGEATDAMLRRFPQALAEASRFGPLAFVFVLGGSNDILAHRSAPDVLAGLRRLHDMAAARGSPCLGIFTVPKCGLLQPHQEEVRQRVNEALREMCQQPGARSKFMLVDLEVVPLELAKDGVHYAGEGYEEFARLVMEAMNSMFEAS